MPHFSFTSVIRCKLLIISYLLVKLHFHFDFTSVTFEAVLSCHVLCMMWIILLEFCLSKVHCLSFKRHMTGEWLGPNHSAKAYKNPVPTSLEGRDLQVIASETEVKPQFHSQSYWMLMVYKRVKEWNWHPYIFDLFNFLGLRLSFGVLKFHKYVRKTFFGKAFWLVFWICPTASDELEVLNFSNLKCVTKVPPFPDSSKLFSLMNGSVLRGTDIFTNIQF